MEYGFGGGETTPTPTPESDTPSKPGHKNYTIETLMNTYQQSVSTSLDGYDGLESRSLRGSDSGGVANTMEEVQFISRKLRWRDWNEEFQTLLDMKPCVDKFEKLAHLEKDFVYTASMCILLYRNSLLTISYRIIWAYYHHRKRIANQ